MMKNKKQSLYSKIDELVGHANGKVYPDQLSDDERKELVALLIQTEEPCSQHSCIVDYDNDSEIPLMLADCMGEVNVELEQIKRQLLVEKMIAIACKNYEKELDELFYRAHQNYDPRDSEIDAENDRLKLQETLEEELKNQAEG